MPDVTLTNSEWYVLDCLWEHSPLTVMELVERLSQKVGWAKSTTITTLRRMEEKGLVHCEVTGRTRHLSALGGTAAGRPPGDRSFLNKVYRGSVGLMVSAMAQDKALTRKEIDELYEILRQAEEGAK